MQLAWLRVRKLKQLYWLCVHVVLERKVAFAVTVVAHIFSPFVVCYCLGTVVDLQTRFLRIVLRLLCLAQVEDAAVCGLQQVHARNVAIDRRVVQFRLHNSHVHYAVAVVCHLGRLDQQLLDRGARFGVPLDVLIQHEVKLERRALAQPLRVDLNGASVLRDEGVTDAKAKTHALLVELLVRIVFKPSERLKELLLVFGGDASAVVADLDRQPARLPRVAGLDCDGAFVRELQCIFNQVD